MARTKTIRGITWTEDDGGWSAREGEYTFIVDVEDRDWVLLVMSHFYETYHTLQSLVEDAAVKEASHLIHHQYKKLPKQQEKEEGLSDVQS